MATGLFGPHAVQSFPLAGGDTGTAQTIGKIRRLIDQGKKSLSVNRLAIAIVWGTPEFSETPKAQAIFDWVRANMRFIRMVVGAQTLRSVDEILRVRGGDCANLNAVLIPSLLETIGIETRLVTIAGDPGDPREFTHIYAEALVDGRWLAMDVARPGAQFGRAPETIFRKRVWDTESAAYRDVAGLSGYHASRSRGRGMGFDWGALTDAIAPITQGTAQIISASRAAPQNIVPISAGAGVVPAGYSYGPTGALVPTASLTATAQGVPSWMILAGGALFVVFLVARK